MSYKNIIRIIAVAALFFGIGSVAQGAAAATFNNDPQDRPTLRTLNYSQTQSSSAWATSVSAGPGDEVSFSIYYHNTGPNTATNVRVRLTPQSTGNGTTHGFTAYLWADNATQVAGSVTVYLSSSQALNYESGTVIWRPNQTVSGSSPLPSGQTGDEIFSSNGLNLGNIAAGWSTQGSVVLRYRVTNNSGNGSQSGYITADPAQSVTNSSAILTCFFNNNNTSGTTGLFEWGTSSNFGNSGGATTITSPITLNYTLTNLTPSTVYYTRCVIQNQYGTNYSTTQTFSTAANPYSVNQPTVITYPASDVSATAATFNGYIVSSAAGATRWFEWGNNATDFTNIGARTYHGMTAGAVSEEIKYLAPNQTYYYRLAASNTYGISYGEIQTFKTVSGIIPSVTTKDATEIIDRHATLNGRINTNGAGDVVRWFEWGTNQQSLNNSTSKTNPGNVDSDFGEAIIGLSSGTTYYFRAVAENSSGKVYGEIKSFTAGIGTVSGPIAVTTSVTNVGAGSAKLNGAALTIPNAQSFGWFEWGTTSGLGNSTPVQTLARVSTAYFAETLSGLLPNTTYYYRSVTKDQSGIINRGAILSFRTGSAASSSGAPAAPKVNKAAIVKAVENLTHPNGTATNISAAPGDLLRFTIEAMNAGDYDLEDAVVRDRLPEQLNFAIAAGGSVGDLQREMSWYIGKLAPGAKKLITIDLAVAESASIGQEIVNRASLQSKKANADSNEIFIHVDEAAAFAGVIGGEKSGLSQTASAFLSFGRNFGIGLLLLILAIVIAVWLGRKIYLEGLWGQKKNGSIAATFGRNIGTVNGERS